MGMRLKKQTHQCTFPSLTHHCNVKRILLHTSMYVSGFAAAARAASTRCVATTDVDRRVTTSTTTTRNTIGVCSRSTVFLWPRCSCELLSSVRAAVSCVSCESALN